MYKLLFLVITAIMLMASLVVSKPTQAKKPSPTPIIVVPTEKVSPTPIELEPSPEPGI